MSNSSIDTSGYPRQALLYGVLLGLVLVILTFVANFVWWLLLPVAVVPANYFDALAVITMSKGFVQYAGITLFWGVLFMLGYLMQAKTFTVIGAALCVYGGLFLALSIGMSSLNSAFG